MKATHKVSIMSGLLILIALLALNAEYWVLYLIGSVINALPLFLIAFPLYLHYAQKRTTTSSGGPEGGNEKNDDQGLSIPYTTEVDKSR